METLNPGILDAIPDGIFVITAQSKLLHANRPGRYYLAAGVVLIQHGDHIWPADHTIRDTWLKMLGSDADNGGSGEVDHHRSVDASVVDHNAISLPRADGGRDCQAAIFELRSHEGNLFGEHHDGASSDRSLLVVISDPAANHSPRAERLADLFGLTPAESRLAAALATGCSINDYADEQGLSVHTARWTVKQLMMKTGSHRQSDMIRLFLTSATSWCGRKTGTA